MPLLCVPASAAHFASPRRVTLTNCRVRSRPQRLSAAARGAPCSCPKFKTQLWVLCLNKSPRKIKHLLCFPDFTQDKAFPFISRVYFYSPAVCCYMHIGRMCVYICECGCVFFSLRRLNWARIPLSILAAFICDQT